MKRVIQAILNQFIYGGHLVSLGPVVILFIVNSVCKLTIPLPFYLLFYLVSFEEYLFDRYIGLANDIKSNVRRTQYLTYYKKLIPYILGACFLATWIMGDCQGKVVLASVVAMQLIGILYSVKAKDLTKKIAGWKNIYIALSFPLVIIVLLLLNKARVSSLLFLYTFFSARLFFSTIFYDIKDEEIDRGKGLKTFPAVLSEKRLLILLQTINIISACIIVIGVALYALPAPMLLYVLVSFYSIYYLWLWKQGKTSLEKVSNLWCDGEFLFWIVLLLIFKLWY